MARFGVSGITGAIATAVNGAGVRCVVAVPSASQPSDWPQSAALASPVDGAQSSLPTAKSPQTTRQQPAGESTKLPLATGPVPEAQVVEILRANWTTLLQAAEAARGASLRGALKTLRNVVAVGDDIYFAFEHDFAKTMVERPANRATVQDLIVKLLGRPVRIHCQVGTQVTGVAPVATASHQGQVTRGVKGSARTGARGFGR